MSSSQTPKSGTRHFTNTVCSPSILKVCGRQSLNNVPFRKVRFNLFDSRVDNVKLILINHDKDKTSYNNFICNIRDSANEILDFELVKLLKDARDCVNILNENYILFVKVILIIKWFNRCDEVVNEYSGFLLDVCTAYNFHTKYAIEQLVSCFSYVDNTVYDRVNGMPNEKEEKGFQNIHTILEALLKAIPLAKDLLIEAIKKKFPYKNNSAESILYYIHNSLHVCEYESIRKNILSLIINKLIDIDVHIPKDELDKLEANENIEIEDIFSMDIDGESMQINSNKREIECFSHTLDICLIRIFMYIKNICHDSDGNLLWDKTKLLYQELLSVFENEILPTYNSSHIQYVIYYFLSFKMILAENFSNWLWKKCCDVSSPSTLRQAAAGYLASFLCRAPFVSNSVLKNALFEISLFVSNSVLKNTVLEMSVWCNDYINKIDKTVKIVNGDLLRWHAVFYSVCQALFYIISFRHQDLMDNKKNLKFMENLNLSNIVTCRLSPLRLCCSTVVNHFAHITKIYQLTYCYAVMEGYIRVTDQAIKDEWLYSFFPFDLYILPRSKDIFLLNLFRDIDNMNSHKNLENSINNFPSSLQENMDISPSMIISPSPTKTDWLKQFTCEINKPKYF